MLILKRIYYFYNLWFNENLDPRLKDLPFTGPPWQVAVILAAYLYFVLGNGQRWMKKREPYGLTKTLLLYNLFQMLANLRTFLMVVSKSPLQENFRFFCIPEPRYDFSPIGDNIVQESYIFFILKIIDLLDTVFFILRKKNNQVTFLHIYHHAGMIIVGYIYMKFYSGGGMATVLCFLNSFVHCVMYGYYFLTAFNPELKKSIWWKKYITQMQILQFFLLMIYAMTTLIFVDCGISKAFVWAGMLQGIMMVILFVDFYYKAYVKKKL